MHLNRGDVCGNKCERYTPSISERLRWCVGCREKATPVETARLKGHISQKAVCSQGVYGKTKDKDFFCYKARARDILFQTMSGYKFRFKWHLGYGARFWGEYFFCKLRGATHSVFWFRMKVLQSFDFDIFNISQTFQTISIFFEHSSRRVLPGSVRIYIYLFSQNCAVFPVCLFFTFIMVIQEIGRNEKTTVNTTEEYM